MGLYLYDFSHPLTFVMSRVGVAVPGNHEDDIPLTQLHNRIRQSKFNWINSNMQSLPLPPDIGRLPEYVVLEASSPSGVHTRRIALTGLLTAEPSLYRKGSFGGSTIEPLNAKAKVIYAEIMSTEEVHAVVAMTHQSIQMDRELAAMDVGYPLIIGGHDHEVYQEVSDMCYLETKLADG